MAETPRRIVVGVDGSLGSVHALAWALREAMTDGAEVEALLVWSDAWAITGPPSLFGAGREGLHRLKATVADAVSRAVREVPGSEAVKVTERVIPGHAAEGLVAESESASMLVVGTTGLSGIRRWMLGSVSQHCAQLAHVPVVIVPTPGHRQPVHAGRRGNGYEEGEAGSEVNR